MITKLTEETRKKHSYTVKRPFTMKGQQFQEGDPIEAKKEDIKFLLKNNLIQ